MNALDDLYDAIKTIETEYRATRIRRFLIVLLHAEEFNLSPIDVNSPYTRFATRNDAEGNRLRLFQALQEKINENDEELQACVDLMFETPDTEPYSKTQVVLQRFKVYADSYRSTDSDTDSDSD